MTQPRPGRRRPAFCCVRVLMLAAVMATVLPQAARADTGLAGLAGTDTSLPLTDSHRTISGSGRFASLRVTVNQTKHLLNQAVSVSWTGGVPTDDGLGGGVVTFQTNFLQIFQCWGDDGSHNGPPPSQCEFGGIDSVPGKRPGGNVLHAAVTSRQVAHGVTRATYDPAQGFLDGDIVYAPYRSVDGTIVNTMFTTYTGPPILDPSFQGQVWVNPFFDYYTTNEIDFGRTYPNGTGSELLQVYTGQQARGLGCGQKVLRQSDGTTTTPKCWLVIVPRSTGAVENAADGVIATSGPVGTSPLAPAAWKNRLVVPLEFNPAESPCTIGATERRIVGNEIATDAVANWQPTLCQTAGLPPYAYASVGDDQARRIVVSGEPGAAGMAVVSSGLDPATVDPSNAVVYAPLTLSGLVIGFNVERVNREDNHGRPVDIAEIPLAGSRVAHINLTPRLVAKLLTESYAGQFYVISQSKASGYDWLKHNPISLFADPDFIQYNPEFRALDTSSQVIDQGGLVLEENTSDAAGQVWQWLLADPEAKSWLAGNPDVTGCPEGSAASSCGMMINPRYVGSKVLNSFPKRDQYCFQSSAVPNNMNVSVLPRPLCMQDVFPYSGSFEEAARQTRAADRKARLEHKIEDPTTQTAESWWSPSGPQIQGNRAILSLTEMASAVRFGLQTASLSRAGDDKASRSFVAPDKGGLLAGAQTMVPSPVAGVLQPDPATTLAGAYPLTTLTYAAVTPHSLDGASRSDYAAFVDYAAGKGQVPGLDLGQLPPGYAPLPDALVAQARAAAAAIRAGGQGSQPSVTTAPQAGVRTPTGSASGAPAGGSGRGGGRGDGSTSSQGGGISAAVPSPASQNPTVSRPNSLPLQIVHTVANAVGAMRYTLPIALAIALLAGLAALLVNQRRGKPAAAPSPPPE